MKHVVLLLLSLFSTVAGYAQPARLLLDAAYKEKSTPKLAQFWQAYQQRSLPISAAELALLPPYQQQAYAVFATFYELHCQRPLLTSVRGSEASSSSQAQTTFLLVQQVLSVKRTRQLYYSDTALDSILSSSATLQAETDSVQSARVRTLRKNGKLTAIVRRNYGLLGDSFFKEEEERAPLLVAALTDFRPLVQVPGKQNIYLTPALAETLTAFLGTPYTPVSSGRRTQPAYAKQQRLQRQAFLERHVQLRYGNWGWQLVSDPLVYSITLDQDMTYARVSFQIGDRGGQAMLKRIDNQWHMVVEQPTWIE